MKETLKLWESTELRLAAIAAAALAMAVCFNQPNTGHMDAAPVTSEPYKAPPRQPGHEGAASNVMAMTSRFRLPSA